MSAQIQQQSMGNRTLDPEAAKAMEAVFRSSHGREMTPEERRYFKMPNGHSEKTAPSHELPSGPEPPQHSDEHTERTAPKGVIAWLISQPDKLLLNKLNGTGYQVIEAYTTDKLVAVCVNHKIDIVILDQHFFVETAGWSVARSVKHIKPHAYVILVARQSWPHDRLPKAVDAVLPSGEPQLLFSLLDQLQPA
jgi:hypothetical protein